MEKKILTEATVKAQFLSGIITEGKYEDLMQQIAMDFQTQMEKEKRNEENLMCEKKEKWARKVDPKKGKMHDILGLKKGEKVSDVYTSGEKLAKALMDKVDDEHKVAGMLAFAANVNDEDDVFDRALRYMKHINESRGFDESDFVL